jgi:hypothetical protein
MSNLTTSCSACNSGKSATDIISSIEKPIPSIDIQIESKEWQFKRQEIINRDGRKCSRCGDTQSELAVFWTTYREGVYVTSVNERDMITVCKDCSEKIDSMSNLIQSFIKEAIIGYRFYDVDVFQYILNFLSAIETASPEHPMVNNIFNAIDLFIQHEKIIDEERLDYEEATYE